jgi:peptidoglycan/LPS O-acetylase OafA/YrhL
MPTGSVRRQAEMRQAKITPGLTRLNSFDGLRLLGATVVLISHSFALTGRSEPMLGTATLGTVGVYMFFGISGFLITQSWVREPRLGVYVAKRALRILPALIAVLILTAFVIGPLVTTVSLHDYFTSSLPWKFVAKNVVMLPNGQLPGVFASNPYPFSANGSLWTLTNEVHAYAIVALLGLAGLYRRRILAVGALAVVVLLCKHFGNDQGHGIVEPRLMIAFALGALLYLWRDHVPWQASVAAVLAILTVALAGSKFGVGMLLIAVPYLSIYLAYRLPKAGDAITRHGDFSYGLYVWAFPFQQVLAHLWHSVTPWAMTAICLPATTCAAIASWHLVERPALKLKARVSWRPVVAGPLHAVEDREPLIQSAGAG